MCPTSSHLRHCVEDELHPLLGGVSLLVYPHLRRTSRRTKTQLTQQVTSAANSQPTTTSTTIYTLIRRRRRWFEGDHRAEGSKLQYPTICHKSSELFKYSLGLRHIAQGELKAHKPWTASAAASLGVNVSHVEIGIEYRHFFS
jgi:hypothetical protein